MFLDALAVFRLLGLGVEQVDDAIGIANRGHFRIGDDDGRVGVAHGKRRPPLDTPGLSQITQSNFARSSSTTRATPSSVSASLSRVCEAGSRKSVSMRLSRI